MPALTYGNRCGHDPRLPRLDLSRSVSHRAPAPIRFFIDRLDRYYYDRKVLPGLAGSSGRFRRMRSERREACILALKALARVTDLETLCVAKPVDGGAVSLKFKDLAKHAGLSLQRFLRAVVDLKNCNYLSVSRIAARGEKGIRGVPAIKALSPDVWGALGLRSMLDRARKAASKRTRRLVRKGAPDGGRAAANVGLAMNRYRAGKRRAAAGAGGNEQQARAYNMAAMALAQEHPDWPPDRLRDELRRTGYKAF